ncbi:hypothetical protein BT96DRAFT_948426 [Gymnopus androsaceus JB14]|uniref:Uncharacterized protein n=1 Tax=Gymnopus androsaceus JB14 TaxID=1447944 RepID=A0A6A4GQ23_9AGAR|nr:hypothetical protein BT96DRAFT_948426 [Gymnopus androsaceus JB14]
MHNKNSNTKLTGQIMLMHSHIERSSEQSLETVSWIWTGRFALCKSKMAGTGVLTDKALVVCFPGHICKAVSPTHVSAEKYLVEEARNHVNASGITYLLDSSALSLLITVLWQRIQDAGIALKDLPTVLGGSSETTTDFPYLFNGEPALVCVEAMNMLETSTVQNHCLNCGKTTSEIKETCIQAHMGNHLLRAQCNIPEPVAFEVVQPCAWDTQRAQAP